MKEFFERTRCDPFIGASHISVYSALWFMRDKESDSFAEFMSVEIAKVAKVSSATFTRAIKMLDRQGYLKFVPSFNHRKKSKVYFKL